MKLDDERLGKYLDEIAAETIDIEKTIDQKGKKKNGLVQDPHILKSLKYSTIVIAEAIASTLQHRICFHLTPDVLLNLLAYEFIKLRTIFHENSHYRRCPSAIH